MLNVNILFVVIFVYICFYYAIILIKPSFIYNKNQDCLRPFGVGYRNTTVLPLWLVSILLAIISYLLVLYGIHIRYNTIFIKS
jgi:hypothetical protein